VLAAEPLTRAHTVQRARGDYNNANVKRARRDKYDTRARPFTVGRPNTADVRNFGHDRSSLLPTDTGSTFESREDRRRVPFPFTSSTDTETSWPIRFS